MRWYDTRVSKKVHYLLFTLSFLELVNSLEEDMSC